MIVSAFALEQQRRAVELEPALEHRPLGEHEVRLMSSWILKVFDHAISRLPFAAGAYPEQQPKRGCCDKNVHRKMNAQQIAFQEILQILHDFDQPFVLTLC